MFIIVKVALLGIAAYQFISEYHKQKLNNKNNGEAARIAMISGLNTFRTFATIAFIFFGFSSHHSLSEIAPGQSSEMVASNPTSGLEQSETVATNPSLISINGNNNTVTTDAGTDYYEIASSESNAWDVAAAVVGILPWIFMML